MKNEKQVFFCFRSEGYFNNEDIDDLEQSINEDLHALFEDLKDEEDNDFWTISFKEINYLKIEFEKFKSTHGLAKSINRYLNLDFNFAFAEFLNKNIEIDYNFAYNAKQFDVICPSCFFPKNEFGTSFIRFLNGQDYKFILNAKVYENTNKLIIVFIACQGNNFYDIIDNI